MSLFNDSPDGICDTDSSHAIKESSPNLGQTWYIDSGRFVTSVGTIECRTTKPEDLFYVDGLKVSHPKT